MNLYQSDVQVTVFVAICGYEFIALRLFNISCLIVCPQQILQPGIIIVAVDGAKLVVGIMVLVFHTLHRASRPSTDAEQPASDSKTNSNNINFFIRQSVFCRVYFIDSPKSMELRMSRSHRRSRQHRRHMAIYLSLPPIST